VVSLLCLALHIYTGGGVAFLQVRSVDVKEALRLQKENNFVILDVRPEAEFKEVSCSQYF